MLEFLIQSALVLGIALGGASAFVSIISLFVAIASWLLGGE